MIYPVESCSIRCGDCDLINRKIDRPYAHAVHCIRCDKLLYNCVFQWRQRCLAYVLAAAVCFIFSYTQTFLILEAGGQQQTVTVLTGVYELIARDQWLLVGIIFMSVFLFALFEIFALSIILICSFIDYRKVWLKRLIKIISHLRPWNMLEIFFVSTLVTAVKLAELADLIPGIGLYVFFILIVLLILAHREIDYVWIWDWIDPHNYFAADEQEAALLPQKSSIRCHDCGAQVSEKLAEHIEGCPRCRAKLHFRKKNSVQKTVALLLAAMILYIPANTYPILHSTNLGDYNADTIVSGAIHLFQGGAWFIAVVIIVASIVVPVAKLCVMGFLVFAVSHGSKASRFTQLQLFRITELVGRWSMIDVFVVVTLVAMVQFGLLANIEPGAATLPFAGVVILTMLAAETFDSRLIWDCDGRE